MAATHLVSKLTIQAAAVAALTLTACAALFLGQINGEQFMILAVAASGWAFNTKSSK